MIESTKGDWNPRTAAIFACAAGVLGLLSNSLTFDFVTFVVMLAWKSIIL